MARSWWNLARRKCRASFMLVIVGCAGCSASHSLTPAWQRLSAPALQGAGPIVPASHVEIASRATNPVVAAEHLSALDEHETIEIGPAGDEPFAGSDFLDPDELVVLVHEHNPSLQAMYAAWEAAAARYPQEVSLDDPMLDVMIAPGSFASSSNVPESWSVEASQKFPWRGKRAFRGQIADANASSAALDADDTRLQLTLAARLAFADYLYAAESLELNADEARLLNELRTIAQVKYETNRSPQQDVLQANVELADARRRRLELTRQQRVAVARINTLLRRQPYVPVPPPARRAAESSVASDSDELLGLAIESRPDLAALGAKIAAEQAAYCLALQEFHPDLEIYGRYDRYWLDPEQQGSVGLKLNLPVRRDRRRAAVEEARARLSRAEAEYEARISQIHLEVATALERLNEVRDVIRLYRDETLNAAEQNVQSARAGYESGAVSFLAMVSAQRQLVQFRRQQVEAMAEYQRQSAELERAVGVTIANKTSPSADVP